MRRKLVALGALVGAALAGFALVRRLRGGGREHVDVTYEDGSVVTLVDADAQPFLEVARAVLHTR
jgi:hypothetical protein